MRFLFVIDELEKLNLPTDTTIEIMDECQRQGIDVYYCTLKDLFFSDEPKANATLISIKNKTIKKGKIEQKNLNFFDLIFMRKEPPYDLNYHYATMILDKASVPILNSPQGLRDANEKLIILNFPNIIPKTLVSNDTGRITAFLNENKRVITKPIHLFGGRGIEVLDSNNKGNDGKIKKITNNGVDYVLVQEFLPSIIKGDKRILLLNGRPLGGIVRVPKKGSFLANLAQGGTAKKLILEQEDIHIIKIIKPYLKKRALVFVGIDIIGDKLIEINLTCPTGLVQLNKLDKRNCTKDIVESLKMKARKGKLTTF